MQTRWESLREALCNTGCAFVLSVLSHRYIIAPLLEQWQAAGGALDDWIPALLATLYYTLLSVARNYIIRRRGNKRVKLPPPPKTEYCPCGERVLR